MSEYTKAERDWIDLTAQRLLPTLLFTDACFDHAEQLLAESIERYGPLEQEQSEPQRSVDLTFDDAIEVVESYLDYSNGYSNNFFVTIFQEAIRSASQNLRKYKESAAGVVLPFEIAIQVVANCPNNTYSLKEHREVYGHGLTRVLNALKNHQESARLWVKS